MSLHLPGGFSVKAALAGGLFRWCGCRVRQWSPLYKSEPRNPVPPPQISAAVFPVSWGQGRHDCASSRPPCIQRVFRWAWREHVPRQFGRPDEQSLPHRSPGEAIQKLSLGLADIWESFSPRNLTRWFQACIPKSKFIAGYVSVCTQR